MNGMDFPGSIPGVGVKDGLDGFDALDVDGLLNYFGGGQSGTFSDPSFSLGGPSPLRPLVQPTAPQGMQGMTGLGTDAAPNLFSSVQVEPPRHPDDSDDSGEGDDRNAKRTAEQKAHAIQEKNRRAQKRFRERQKAKMKDMTEQLDDMGSELGKLRMENNALKNRNSILEKVLALRDEHIRMLQDEQQVFDLGNHYLSGGPGKMLSGGPESLPMLGGGPGQLQALPAPGGSGAYGGDPSGMGGSSGALTAGGAYGTGLLPSGSLVPSEIQAIKSMPAEMVVSRWKEMVRELGNILVQIEGSPGETDPRHVEGMANLCRVLDAAGTLCMHTAVLHPTNMQKLIAMALDDGRSGVSAEDRQRWASVTASLALTPDQKSQIVSLRRIFLRRMARVVEERRAVLSKLQSVHIPDRMLALQSVINETLKVNECTVKLKANLQEEHLAGMEFIGTVFKTVFGKLQKARAIVQSYPYYPDIYQISTLLAMEREGVNALDIAGATGAASQLVSVPVTYRG